VESGPFEDALRDLGFVETRERPPHGARRFEARPNGFLTWWVHAYGDGTALFTWEFAIAEYLTGKGMQIGSNEALNQFLYPARDVRGPQDPAWLAEAIDWAEGLLASVSLLNPDEDAAPPPRD